jgi:DNA-binding transcriptional MocR family regulator
MNVTDQFTISGGTAREIAASVERAVRSSQVAPGTALPAIRSLAHGLGLSPTTVAAAYRQLRLRGIVTADGRRGTRISHRPPIPARAPDSLPPGVRDLASGNPDPKLLPDLTRVLERLPGRPLYGDRMNSPELIDLAAGEFSSDGVPGGPVAVVGGALDGIERVLAAHLRPGDRVGVEDPGFTRVLDLMAALGLIAIPMAIDSRGVIPEALAGALASRVEAIVITPRAHNPTGAALDANRGAELSAVLQDHPGVLVVEDDHASSIAGVNAVTLCRARERWAIVRSVSKALGPDLRLAVMIGDAATIARVEGRQLLGTGWVSRILQDLVVAMWVDPATPSVLAEATSAYTSRRGALIEAMGAQGIQIEARSGSNLWIDVPDEAAAVAALVERGWAVARGEPFRLRTGPAVRVTTATLSPEESMRFAVDMKQSLEPTELRTYA